MESIETLPQVTTPDQLLAQAVNQNLDLDKLEKLMALQERWQAGLAKKAFFNSLTEFQNECPDLRKTKEVAFGQTKYHYAPLGDIDRQIKALLKKHGLSKRWEISDANMVIKVKCIITHIDGHSEATEMEANADVSGSKNAIQAKGSAIEYMKRYTLIGALGLTTADQDIDGRMPEMDIDKLHKSYMELYEKIVLKDESFRTPGHPDNWATERTPNIYVQAIGKARQILAKLTANDARR